MVSYIKYECSETLLCFQVRSKEKSDCYKQRSKSVDRLKECTNQACQKVYTACMPHISDRTNQL